MTPGDVLDAVFVHMTKPFRWGLRTDCTVACAAFEALHGVDPLSGFTGSYDSASGAFRIISRAGGYRNWCQEVFGLPEISHPGAGDLALVESSDPLGAALAICVQPGEFATKSETGLTITRRTVLEAWTCRS